MEGPLDHNPTPGTGPRNLTVQLAAWLRRMGFTVTERGWPQPDSLTARWVGLTDYFDLDYCFVASTGVLRLACTDRQTLATAPLVAGAYVQRIREARFLLLGSSAYATARQAALTLGTLLPAHAQPPA